MRVAVIQTAHCAVLGQLDIQRLLIVQKRCLRKMFNVRSVENWIVVFFTVIK